MSTVAILPSNFNPAKLTAKQLKVLDNGGKAVNLEFDGKGLWMVQTPVTQLPYGMNIFDKDGKAPKYSVDLSFRDAETDPKVKAFHEFAKADLTRDVVKAFYTPMVKIPVDKEGKPKPYPPTVKIALKQKDGVFTTEFYDPSTQDARGQPKRYEGVPVEELLVRGARIRTIIRCTGLWIAGSKFGPSWKAEQVSIEGLPERLRGFGFVDDGEARPAQRSQTGGQQKPSANHFNQLDDDEEESAVVAVLPSKKSAPAPPADEDEDEDGAEVMPAVPVPSKPKGPTKGPAKKTGAK